MSEIRDEFLSEEDLDLRNMTWEEVMAYSVLWLEQAQATNYLDAHRYSHGVFEREPPWNERSSPADGDQHPGDASVAPTGSGVALGLTSPTKAG